MSPAEEKGFLVTVNDVAGAARIFSRHFFLLFQTTFHFSDDGWISDKKIGKVRQQDMRDRDYLRD